MGLVSSGSQRGKFYLGVVGDGIKVMRDHIESLYWPGSHYPVKENVFFLGVKTKPDFPPLTLVPLPLCHKRNADDDWHNGGTPQIAVQKLTGLLSDCLTLVYSN